MLDELTRGKLLGLLTSRQWRKVLDIVTRRMPSHEVAYTVNEVADGAVRALLSEMNSEDRRLLDAYIEEMDELQKRGGDPCRLAALRTVLYTLALTLR